MADGILHNDLILRGVFRHLSIPALRNCRLVCIFWLDVAKEFLNGRVWVYLKAPFPGLEELTLFLLQNGISHGLNLSFCKHAWTLNILQLNEEKVPACGNYEEENRIVEYDRQILDYVNTIGHLVYEFRLESKYMNAVDSKFLKKLLNPMTNCREVFLQMLDFRDEAWTSTEENLLPNSVLTFGVQLVRMFWNTDETKDNATFTLDGCLHFMNCCSECKTLKLLDIHGPAQIFNYPQKYSEWGSFWTKAVGQICNGNKAAFPKLCGIRQEISHDEDLHEIKAFPRGLRELHLYMAQIWLGKLLPLLCEHSSTLEILDLELVIPSPSIPEFVVLPLMPNLQRLDFNLVFASRKYEGWDLSSLDMIGLRAMFMDPKFPLNYPKLDTLSVFCFFEYGMEIWEWIFPSFLPNGERLILGQIKVLNISLISECEWIGRILEVFPALRVFRHVLETTKDNEEWYTVCEHRGRHSGNLAKSREITEWIYKEEVSNYLGNMNGFITSRLRYQLGGGGPFQMMPRHYDAP